MDAKKKIVELIAQKVCDTWSESCDEWLPRDCGKCYANDCHISELADHLIANGVTVQECKIGDKIYQTDGVLIYESTIVEITVTTKHTIFVTENIVFDERAIGETIFLSYSEAEAHSHKPPKGE